MCQRVTCRRCGKATWSGCGQHVDQVMRGVPAGERCTCSRERASEQASEQASGRGFLGRLFGR